MPARSKGVLSFIVFSLLFSVVWTAFMLLGKVLTNNSAHGNNDSEVINESVSFYPSIVIDPGHGGEDGGASSYGGAPEKELNLLISEDLREILEIMGIKVVMTREDDRLLYDPNSDHIGHKKSLDLAARLKIAKETENSILISIHMNAFPEQKYKGLQVYYSGNSTGSSELARIIQSKSRAMLMPDNDREIKKAGSNIYLLHRFYGTGVLIECGFLSNDEEREKLNTSEYRNQLAACFFSAIAEYISDEGK